MKTILCRSIPRQIPKSHQLPLSLVRITAAKYERWEKTARNKPSNGAFQSSSATEQPTLREDQNLAGPDPPPPENEGGFATDTSDGSPDKVSSHSPSTLSAHRISPIASSSTLSLNNTSPIASSSAHSPNTINPLVSNEILSTGQEHDSLQLLASNAPQSSPLPRDSWPWLLPRLFSALSLALPDDMLFFCQRATATEITTQDRQTISNEEFKDMSHGGNGDTPWNSTAMALYNPASTEPTMPSPFKFSGVDAILSTQEMVFANPLNVELYPFPRYNRDGFDSKVMPKYHDILRTEMRECLDKIHMFESVTLGNTEAATVLIDRLAVAYFGLGHYDQAERQFKRILPTLLLRHGPNSRYVVSVKRDLAEVILHLGRFNEANQMAHEVHAAALNIDIPGGSLVQKSLHVLAQSFGNLRNLEKEEELLRQLVQIRLVAFSPRHGETLAAIRSLCDSLTDAHRHSESEELLRVALELSQSADVSDRRKCLICRKLATVLYKLGSYRESEALYRKSVDMSVRLLGNEHPDTLRCRFWMCKALRARGFLDESLELLLQTVEQQIRTRGELRGSTIESMAGLSNLLVQIAYRKRKQDELEAVELPVIQEK